MRNDVTIREAVTDGELAQVLALNNAALPAVNALEADALAALTDLGTLRIAADLEGSVLGALLTLGPGCDYDSLNYAWFSARYDNFVYVDRIVVDEAAKGRGIGRRLYEDALARAEADSRSHLLAEVNVDPPNPASRAFHAKLGFHPLIERLNVREGKVVVMLERRL